MTDIALSDTWSWSEGASVPTRNFSFVDSTKLSDMVQVSRSEIVFDDSPITVTVRNPFIAVKILSDDPLVE